MRSFVCDRNAMRQMTIYARILGENPDVQTTGKPVQTGNRAIRKKIGVIGNAVSWTLD